MIIEQDREIVSTDGKYVHIIGTDSYGRRFPAIGITAAQCEEADEVPQTADTNTRAYDDKVNELIRNRYTLSEELGILRQRDVKTGEYEQYYAYCEQCKAEAKQWIAGHQDGEA